MEDDKTLVRLVDIEDLKEEMQTIGKYCDFIDETLRKLSRKEKIYLHDLKKCIERIERIRTYAVSKANGDDLQAKMSFVFDEM